MQIAAQHLGEIVEAIRKLESGNSGKDKRKTARQPVQTKVEVLSLTSGRTFGALTRDLSIEGIGLLQSVAMTKGERFSVCLPRGKHGPIVAECTVMHIRELADGLWGIGATFLSVTTVNPDANAPDPEEAQRIAAKMLT